MDEYDELPNVRSYLLYSDIPRAKIGSIRICEFDPDKDLDVPAMEMFYDEIKRSIGYNRPFIEANRFVIDPEFQRLGGRNARFKIFERVVDSAIETGAENILIAVRPEHVKFYGKTLFFEPISGAKVYHHVKFKTVLCKCSKIERFKEFVSSKLYGIADEPAPNYRLN